MISLADASATRPGTVGGKAAWLSRALRLGLPVLPGMVVPVGASADAMAAGSSTFEVVGVGPARRSAMQVELDPRLLEGLGSISTLGDLLVVRSSSSLDDHGGWAGTFASYGDVRPDEVGHAVRGCWASVFAPGTLDRLRNAAIDVRAIGLAVLIQRQVEAEAGGWAAIRADRLQMSATTGHPAALLNGHVRGQDIELPLHGKAPVAEGSLPISARAARELVEAIRTAYAGMGANRMEWAVEAGRPIILQLARLPDEAAVTPLRPDAGGFEGAAYVRMARLLATHRGLLADMLLTPWSAGLVGEIEAGAETDVDRLSGVELSAQIRRQAEGLNGAAADAAKRSVPELREALARGVEIGLATWRLDDAQSATAAQLLAGACSLATELVTRGALPSGRALWWQTIEWLEAATAGGRPPAATAPRGEDRWSDLLDHVVRREGQEMPATPAAAGRAVGRATVVTGERDAARLEPGDVLVTDQPDPALAPLLWRCAGLVAAAGSPAAHLCEVARALHKPAVVGAAVRAIDGSIVGLDGSAGAIWQWDP